jgi:hypothetical protein
MKNLKNPKNPDAKRMSNIICGRRFRLRRKEKKRQLIEQIKKERLENSLIFNNN